MVQHHKPSSTKISLGLVCSPQIKKETYALTRFERFKIDPNNILKTQVPSCYSVKLEKLTLTPEIKLNYPPIPYVANRQEDEKDIFKYLIKTHWKNCYIISTDGAKGIAEQNLGAAMEDYSGRPITAKMLKLHPHTEIFEAEAKALLLALYHDEDITPGKEVKILVDNKGLLTSLQNFIKEQESEAISNIREKLADLTEAGKKISLNWVPSHKGIGPNEMADYVLR